VADLALLVAAAVAFIAAGMEIVIFIIVIVGKKEGRTQLGLVRNNHIILFLIFVAIGYSFRSCNRREPTEDGILLAPPESPEGPGAHLVAAAAVTPLCKRCVAPSELQDSLLLFSGERNGVHSQERIGCRDVGPYFDGTSKRTKPSTVQRRHGGISIVAAEAVDQLGIVASKCSFSDTVTRPSLFKYEPP
jgi:hypothetical protein